MTFAPLGWALGVLMFVGVIFPYALGFFIDVGDIELNGVTQGFYTLLDEGITFNLPILNEVTLDFFSIMPDFIENQVLESITYLSLLPEFLVIIIIVMSPVAIVYSLIKMVLG